MLRKKIDQKAHDLFKEKPGQAPMTVTTIFKSDKKNSKLVERKREVSSLSDIKRLQNVRFPVYSQERSKT